MLVVALEVPQAGDVAAAFDFADFDGCVQSAETAISKGDLKRDDESYITLGMCQFEVAAYEG